MRVLLLVLMAVTACSSGTDTVASSDASPSPATALQVEVVASPGAPVRQWTLTCDPTGGDHPTADQACRQLAQEQAPFAPLDPDRACTELYGGPETAVVRGTHAGQPVSLDLARTDGCRIAQWDALGAVLAPEA